MKQYKACLFLMGIMIVVCALCGCTQRQIVRESDELKSFSWQGKDDYGKQITLCFDENYATLSLKSDRTEKTIQGFTITDNQSFEIYDNSLYQHFRFSYRLYGDKIELSYRDNTLTLAKMKQ